jgi:hypothetical protein
MVECPACSAKNLAGNALDEDRFVTSHDVADDLAVRFGAPAYTR